MNHQPISVATDDGSLLYVHSIFSTIQGEGPFTGFPAIFIRLGGCNLQCPLCDTDYTSDIKLMTPHQILEEVQRFRLYGLVVITGGEPLRQDIETLVNVLLKAGFKVQIETNGTLYRPLPFYAITIVCSPKGTRIHPAMHDHISALKYVVHADAIDPDDGLPIYALGHTLKTMVARPPLGFLGPVYVQPIDVQDVEENQRHLKAAIASVMRHGYRLCLQTHKIIGLE